MAVAVAAGAVAVAGPLVAGVVSFLTPLFRKPTTPKVRVALLDQVPDDGMPRLFPIVAQREDAWTRHPNQRVGAVYLLRQPGETQPIAFTAKCPHAGCFIGFQPGDDQFACPCHTSAFRLDGTRLRGDAEVSPRDMDRLPVSVESSTAAAGSQVAEVWVEFIDYQTGHKEAIPSA
jgi:menaquinol-cytochrome c reductase iron-sulfur subunit